VLGAQVVPTATARPGREGAPVGFHHFPDDEQAQLFLVTALRDLSDREPEASVGIIAATADAARRVFEAIQGIPQVRLVTNGAFTFEPGIDVTDVESVKGLEFDYVIIPDATALAYPATDEARRKLHVAVTRTSHQLWVLSSGRRSPMLGT
jgi:DNA helicase-2/ATP-dependent DNA helicase PcrA